MQNICFKKIAYFSYQRNSFYIFLNTVTISFLGFIFWMIASRLYNSEDIGIAAALISSTGIITYLSGFGLGTSLIRFLPNSSEKKALFTTILVFSTVNIVLLGSIFIIEIDLFAPSLEILKDSFFAITFLIFLILVISSSLFSNALLAFRKANLSFLQNFVSILRLLFLILLSYYGVAGIFWSLGLSYLVSVLIGIYLLSKMGPVFKPAFKIGLLKGIIPFSIANYISDLLAVIETSILSIIILNEIGPSEAAYFYIAFSIVGILYAVPTSVFTSLLIECSHGEPLIKNIKQSIFIILMTATPLALVMYLFGGVLLSLFGNEYFNAYGLLKLFILSLPLFMITTMYLTIKKIQKDNTHLILASSFLVFSTTLFSFFLIQYYGLIGAGIGWIAGQGITTVLILSLIFKEGWTNIHDGSD